MPLAMLDGEASTTPHAGQARSNFFTKFRRKNRAQVAVSAMVFRSAMNLVDVVQIPRRRGDWAQPDGG